MLAGRPRESRRQHGCNALLRAKTRYCLRMLPRGVGVILALGTMATGVAQTDLPDAPVPHSEIASAPNGQPGFLANVEPNSGLSSEPVAAIAAATAAAAGQETFPPEARPLPGLSVPGLQPTYVPLPTWCVTHACTQVMPARSCCRPGDDVFSSYLRQYAVHNYTPKELGKIAIHAVVDPFNLMTIGATSLISVGTDAHSPYGPGFHG